jgi:hypothetical protein
LLELCAGAVGVPIAYRLELAAIRRDDGIGEKIQGLAKRHKLARDGLDCFAVVFAETGDRTLKSGVNRPVSRINSTLRWASRSRRWLD